jgi:hypothetical protein
VRRALLRVLSSVALAAAGSAASGMTYVQHDRHRVVMASASAVKCDIRSRVEADGIRLEAIARSKESVQGEYVFSVLKQSSSGSSQSEQGGDFTIAHGGDAVLTTVFLDAAARDHYRANLTITWDHGRVACQSPEASDRI